MNPLRRLRRRRMAAAMSCAEVGAVLQRYLDDELPEDAAPLVEAHLELCRRCGLEASIYRDLKQALAHRSDPPPDAVSRLREFGERLAHGDIPPDMAH